MTVGGDAWPVAAGTRTRVALLNAKRRRGRVDCSQSQADDTFVRNVVVDAPEDKLSFVNAMLEDVPVEASDEALMVSALQHEAIPTSFVRLDDPAGETVVSKVLALDVETSKYELLVSLGRAARHGGEGAVEKIEAALDNLGDLEDVEGIEAWIEDALL